MQHVYVHLMTFTIPSTFIYRTPPSKVSGSAPATGSSQSNQSQKFALTIIIIFTIFSRRVCLFPSMQTRKEVCAYFYNTPSTLVQCHMNPPQLFFSHGCMCHARNGVYMSVWKDTCSLLMLYREKGRGISYFVMSKPKSKYAPNS